MKDFNLKDLQHKTKQYKNTLMSKQKESYQYARNKGFTSYEAVILQNKSKKIIDKIAEEKGLEQCGAEW